MLKKFMKKIFSIQRSSRTTIKVCFLFLSFRLKKTLSAKELLEFSEKELIANSPFWDALWYIKTYNHKFNRFEALDYWYEKGWKKGENPSPYLNVSYIKKQCDGVNPIIAYMSRQIVFQPDNKNNHKTEDDDKKIAEYLKNKKTRKAKSVIYTCITNDYDDIYELKTYKYINDDWDYVCFTDNKEDIKKKQIGIWEIRPLAYSASDVSRNNRWHKMHPHKLFSEYDESIYIDANINILSDFLFKEIKNKDKDFVLPRHFKNVCVFQELSNVSAEKMDTDVRINQAHKFLSDSKMPQNYGFCENNVLYRRHNKPQIINMMNEWWDLLEKYAKRDQLYLTYLLWKQKIAPKDITFENTRLLYRDFYVFGHKKRGEQ